MAGIPAHAGIHAIDICGGVDSRVRGNDENAEANNHANRSGITQTDRSAEEVCRE